MTDNYYALILAGGGGTRLWPLSRRDRPKQLLQLIDDRSMFQLSVDRLAPLFPPERIYIVTGAGYVEPMREQTPQIPAGNFIVEPSGRDSAPAAALGAAVIHQRDPQAVIAQLAVDHHIGKPQTFLDLLRTAGEMAGRGYIVTLGIAPSYPATGFGYIRQGEAIAAVNGFTCYHTRGFTEKPDEATAQGFIASGEYSWNSGMFIWTAARAMAEFQSQQPAMYDLLTRIAASVDTSRFDDQLREIWPQMPKISIDYAVMENAAKMAVIPADVAWNDVGSWEALFEVHPADESGNLSRGAGDDRRVLVDTQNTLAVSGRMVVTIGVEDLIIVDTDDVLLVCHRERSQEIREIVNRLRDTGRDEYL